jgi:hypothetical protein
MLLALGAILALLVGTQVATASHPEASLPGSNFEIDENANLKVDDPAPSIDWLTGGADTGLRADVVTRDDEPSGQNDDSYSGGAKEDDTCHGTTTGSIPNNKSDLLSFGAYVEPEVGGPGFLNLFWTRVQEPSGTTLMDFELNQSSTDCGNGVNPVRTAGDLLIEYRIEQGGARAVILVREWTGTQWGAATDLTALNPQLAAGTINQTPIPANEADGLPTVNGQLSARTFGEAQLDLDFIFNTDECQSFGSAFIKSRASTSFTSQLKDFIKPIPVDIQNCGNIIINKETVPSPDPTDTTFNYTTTGGLDPATFTLKDGESQDYGDEVTAGAYTVTEADPSPDFALTELTCDVSGGHGSTASTDTGTRTATIDLKAQDTVECTYTNTLQRGAIRILKNSTKGGAVSQPGAVFSYDGSSVTDNGTGDQDQDVGEVCVAGLTPGDYTVNETSPPDGYGDASESDLTATAAVGTNCTDNQPTGTGVVTFTNAPLADIQVNFRDGGSGETSTTSMSCSNTGTTPSTTPATGWDESVTHEGIAIDPSPRTITCEIVIDP